MAHNSLVPSLSQTSDDAISSDHSPGSFATLHGGGSITGSGAIIGQPSLSNHFNNNNNNLPPPSDTTSNYYLLQRENMNNNQPQYGLVTPSKRPRGRPSGSKNKPKAPIIIRQESEHAMKSVVIEIPIGKDVIEGLINFARHHRVDISVLSGSGSVTDITLRHHVSCASVFPIHGTFRIISLTGSYIGVRFPSLASPNHPSFPPCSSFGICVAGPQGQVFGGVIGGRVMAASVVVVMAIVFKKPEFHRLSLINENVVDEGDEEGEKENDENNNNINGYAGIINGGHSGGANIVPNSNINNNGILMMPNMSGFGVSNSVGQLNRQMHVANMNMLQWNHLNHLQ
ncbi:hypothetical protein TanjilG_19005 [Lupinus angustifolius]|uniref:PPC domain-containing protein n=1 Tax=Lupinus angustifolius TaxID=3871 RepID=A0A4P1RRY5_LUPAN|nr:PREDICTED: AT-hook motif nuclear-localized protein 28-like [Lupinus angustifolius]OIW16289.1 hypothetical protein TanjilG_19005 [Lupinus angustifolius]